MSARQGKIARLSAALREELNARIHDGQSARTILGWLNSHPECKRVLERDFEGLLVSDQNLSKWRAGGYADWEARHERLARTKEMAAHSVRLAEACGGKLTQGAAAILAGRVMEVIEDIDRTSQDPEAAKSPENLALSAAALDSLSKALSSLRVGDQNDKRLEQNEEKLALLRSRLEQAERALALEQNKFMRLTCEKFIDWSKNTAAMQIAGSVATNSEKIAQLGPLMFGELWKEDEGK